MLFLLLLMANVNVETQVPVDVLESLQECEGVLILGHNPTIYDLTESAEGTEAFIEHLRENVIGEAVYDPFVSPIFGNPLAPFVNPQAQAEVFNLLSTFQPLLAGHFANNGPAIPWNPMIFAGRNFLGGLQFQHAKVVLLGLIEELQTNARFANQCPVLFAVPPGNVVCNLMLQYTNANIAIQIRKR